MTMLLVQVFILIGVWINVFLGIIALRDRRRNSGLHR
jgi:hypothetical protein